MHSAIKNSCEKEGYRPRSCDETKHNEVPAEELADFKQSYVRKSTLNFVKPRAKEINDMKAHWY